MVYMKWVISRCEECSNEKFYEYIKLWKESGKTEELAFKQPDDCPCVRFCVDYEELDFCERHLLEILSQKEEFLRVNKND